MRAMGYEMAVRLLEFVDTGETPAPVVVPTEIVLRATV